MWTYSCPDNAWIAVITWSATALCVFAGGSAEWASKVKRLTDPNLNMPGPGHDPPRGSIFLMPIIATGIVRTSDCSAS